MKLIKTIQNIFKSIIKDDCTGMAAEMAYNFTLSLFPLLISAAAIFGMLGTQGVINKILHFIKPFAPQDALNILESTLREIIHPYSGGLLTISFIAGLFIASNSIFALRKVLNRAYGVPETRPYIKIRALAMITILIFIFAIFFITNVVIMGNVILDFLHNKFHINDGIIRAILLAKWPVTFAMLTVIGFIIYYFIPNITANFKSRFLSTMPGTVFFTLAWLGVSRLFGLYVENFGSYNKVYGTLGAFIILLLWLYYTSLVILIGGEINSEVFRQIKSKNN